MPIINRFAELHDEIAAWPDGDYEVSVRATDGVGNVGAPASSAAVTRGCASGR